MSKVILIGELPLNILIRSNGSVALEPCDRIGRTAAALARSGIRAEMVGEAAADPVGSSVVDFLTAAGVDVRSVDRFTEGAGYQRDRFEQPDGSWLTVGYDSRLSEEFDCIWPRIDEDDVVVFGSWFALSERVRPRLNDLLSHARARKATIVYLPYFEDFQVSRVTRVMPSILDNMEMADVIIATTGDLQRLFGSGDAEKAYRDHLEFYTPRVYVIDPAAATIAKYPGPEITGTGAGACYADTTVTALTQILRNLNRTDI